MRDVRMGHPTFPLDYSLSALVPNRFDQLMHYVFIGELLVGMFAVERLVEPDLL